MNTLSYCFTFPALLQPASGKLKMLNQSNEETLYDPCAGLGIKRQVTFTQGVISREEKH